MSDEHDTDLGPCCGCETTAGVRNIMMLRYRAPIAGHGWGCLQCGLPNDGASAVVCDDCLEKTQAGKDVIRFACCGYPAIDGRIAIGELTEPFDHDESLHPELQQQCRVCGCHELDACFDKDRGACHWVEPGLCSHCVEEF